MDSLIDHLHGEWVLIAGAPFLCVALIGIAASVAWKLATLHYGERFKTLEATINLWKDRAENPSGWKVDMKVAPAVRKDEELKVVPTVAGKWHRPYDRLDMEIKQSGVKITSNFTHDHYSHSLEGKFDFTTMKFEHLTKRVDLNNSNNVTIMRGSIELRGGKLRVSTIGTDGQGDLPIQFNEIADLDKVS